jgi:replication fork clamp-binding protein CrfC
MTIEERLNRIEHFSVAADEQRRKDRETDRALWRDTQRQLNDLTLKLADLGDRVAEIAEESRAEDRRLAGRMEEADRQSRARDQELRDRIEAMISAMGGYIREHPPTE